MAFPIMLTFDLDAESGALAADAANANRPGVLSIGQYGPRVGVHRILRLLADEGIAATFFVPGWVVDRYPAAVEAIVKAGHEIGHHGYTHTPPAQFPDRASEEAEFAKAIDSIVRVAGTRPLGSSRLKGSKKPRTFCASPGRESASASARPTRSTSAARCFSRCEARVRTAPATSALSA